MKASNKLKQLLGLAVFVAVSGLGIASATAQSFPEKTGYLIDNRGNVVRNNFNECWKTGYWTPAMAIAECDASLVKKAEVKPTPVPEGPAPAAFAKVTLQAETLFDFDKSVLRKDGQTVLDDFVTKMKDHPNVDLLLVTGYTDRIGTDAYNKKLSERRAATVKKYLVSKGIEDKRIETEGKGKADPVVACKGIRGKKLISCLQPNRRVVVEIKMQRAPK
ncbi:MAG: OmpA family protein [Burkholderiales bacterium]